MEIVRVRIGALKIKDRVRREGGDIEGLAASMMQFKQLQPIIVTRELDLIAGGRRVAAAIHNKWEEIDAVYYDTLDELTRREVELEENLRRKELTWVEEVKAVRKIYELKQSHYGVKDTGRPGPMKTEGYGLEDASQDLDRALSTISQDLMLAKALDEYPDLANEKSKTAALRRYTRDRENAARAAKARLYRDKEPVAEPVTDDRQGDTVELKPGDPGTLRQPVRHVGWKGKGILYNGDSRDVLRNLKDATVDCVLTDPPYALGMFKEGAATSGQRLADAAGDMYDDDPERVMNMLDEVFMHVARVLKPTGHAYVFFHMTRYDPMFLMLEKHFGHCDPVPIIWIKNTPGIGDPNTRWVYAYEPCFWVNRGNKLVKPQAFNYLRYDTVQKKIHPTEKPTPLLRHIISASCVPGEIVLDPFVGSGSTLAAAYQTGCRFIGIEGKEKFYRAATDRLAGDLSEEVQPDAAAGTA